MYATNDCPKSFEIRSLSELNLLPNGTQKWTGYICSSCGELTPSDPEYEGDSSRQECRHCNMPHTDEEFIPPSRWIELGQSVQITKNHEIKEAESGPLFRCPNCGTTFFRSGEGCPGCGETTEEAKGIADQQIKAKTSLNAIDTKADTKKAGLLSKTRHWIGAALIGISSFAGLGYGLSTYEIEATVEQSSYKLVVDIERFSLKTTSDFEAHLLPRDPVFPVRGVGGRGGVFNIRNPRMKVHHYDSRQVGTQSVTKTRSVITGYRSENTEVSNGNGSFRTESRQVPEYGTETYTEQEPVYQKFPVEWTYVDYDYYDWVKISTDAAEGVLDSENAASGLPWPKRSMGDLERENRRADFEVVVTSEFRSKQRSDRIHPKSEEDFVQYLPSSKVKYLKNNFGWIVKIKSVDPQ